MAFQLWGVEFISLLLKICHCRVNCPPVLLIECRLEACMFCKIRTQMIPQLGFVLYAQKCEMRCWHLVCRLELSTTISRLVSTAWKCVLGLTELAYLQPGTWKLCRLWIFKSVTGLTVASCILFVWFGASPWSSLCWVVADAGCFLWWLRTTVYPAACFWAAVAVSSLHTGMKSFTLLWSLKIISFSPS